MKTNNIIILILINGLILCKNAFSQKMPIIEQDNARRMIILSDSSHNLMIRLNYSNGCSLDKIIIKGIEVTGRENSVYTGVRLGSRSFSSEECNALPLITIDGDSVKVNNIEFGDAQFAVKEEWIFKVNRNNIEWRIRREYLNNGIVQENDFPCWRFNSMKTWDGAMLDNGGVAWNRLLNRPGDTYGAHTGTFTFWNNANNSCLRITSSGNPELIKVATFHHDESGTLSVVQSASTEARVTKYNLNRFLNGGGKVFAPISVNKSDLSICYTLQVLTYDQAYDRGVFKGINEKSVNEMLNTIGRYGVIDRNLYGSNGWRSGYVVLQEPWLALLGLAVDAPDFIHGYSQALEYEKEHAILSNGRVLPRWHYDGGDAMPYTYRTDGFYECQWGYMLDAQAAYAIDVAEQFDMTGDINWLRQFKATCEKVLGYMINKFSVGNGLFRVVQDTYKEHQGSDWMDVIWTSYEVASINAYMYKALVRWSALEKLLGDEKMSEKYKYLACRLKMAFNKGISDGGFWNPGKKWYVYWRQKDGAVFGNNLVSSVNFLAIGYGLCDDSSRKEAILNHIEKLMEKEKLFMWPLCFFPYKDSVGLDVNYPFPNYENGDLFLAWAELGTRCYVPTHPEIALKYIRNVIRQYEINGLAYQRYKRQSQIGVGNDILSNNIMAIVGLYRNIYGIRPQYNRLYLDPHLTKELSGTIVKYWLRNQNYIIDLSTEVYSIKMDSFLVSNNHPFAVNCSRNKLEYFNGNNSRFSLKILSKRYCSIDILNWGKNFMIWKETSNNPGGNIDHEVFNLKPNKKYQLYINNKPSEKLITNLSGMIRFNCPAGKNILEIQQIHCKV